LGLNDVYVISLFEEPIKNNYFRKDEGSSQQPKNLVNSELCFYNNRAISNEKRRIQFLDKD